MSKKGSLSIAIPTEKLEIGGIQLGLGDYESNTIYIYNPIDKKGNKHINIDIPIIFNKGIHNRKFVINKYDSFVMNAFFTLFVENYKNNNKKACVIYLSDIYMKIYGTDKPQKAQRDKIKESIAKLRTTTVNIDYSNFLKNEEMKKRYSEKNIYKDLEVQSRIDINIIRCDIVEYPHPKTKKQMTKYVLWGLPLLNIIAVKERYKTLDSRAYSNLRLNDANISVTDYLIRCLNAKPKPQILSIDNFFKETSLKKDAHKRYLEVIYNCLENIYITQGMYKSYKTLDRNNNITDVRKDIEKIKFIY